VRVARLRIGKVRTYSAWDHLLRGSAFRIRKEASVTVDYGYSDLAVSELQARCASLVARTKAAPRTDFTMNRARAVVAVNSLGSGAASSSSVTRRDINAGNNVRTSTARYTAGVVVTPIAFNAVYRTLEHVASLEIGRDGAFSTAVGRLVESPGAHLHAAGHAA
jgi:hypothetical protein